MGGIVANSASAWFRSAAHHSRIVDGVSGLRAAHSEDDERIAGRRARAKIDREVTRKTLHPDIQKKSNDVRRRIAFALHYPSKQTESGGER
jgi:hypothetical protein